MHIFKYKSFIDTNICRVLRVSEWLLFNTKWSFFFWLYHGENKLHSIRWWCPHCTRPTCLVGFFLVLVHCNKSPWIDMSLHYATLLRFRANQSLLLLLNAACLAEKQQISILQSLVWLDHVRCHLFSLSRAVYQIKNSLPNLKYWCDWSDHIELLLRVILVISPSLLMTSRSSEYDDLLTDLELVVAVTESVNVLGVSDPVFDLVIIIFLESTIWRYNIDNIITCTVYNASRK